MPCNCANCDDCPFDGRNIPADHHEIHVTVRGEPERFRTVCELHGIKPIVIAYEGQQGQQLTDVMTSQPFRGTNNDALHEALGIRMILRREGFEPIRTKIETTPTNPVVQTDINGYFEAHVLTHIPIQLEKVFREIMADHECSKSGQKVHVSRNAYRTDGETKKLMVTFRLYGNDLAMFQHDLEELVQEINGYGFTTNKVISEFCWHDTNRDHDQEWMGAA